MTYSSFRCLPCTYLILIVRHHLDLLPGWHDIVLAIQKWHRGGADRHVITVATSTKTDVGGRTYAGAGEKVLSVHFLFCTTSVPSLRSWHIGSFFFLT